MVCKNCGNFIGESEKFCPSCGAPAEHTEQAQKAPETTIRPSVQQNDPYSPPQINPSTGKMNTTQLVWSIINLVMCCQIAGIVSLVLTIMASSATTAEDENGKLKWAKILNLIGTIGGALIVVVSVVAYVFFIFMAISEGENVEFTYNWGMGV